MIDKKDIIKMAQNVFRRSQGIPDKRLMHPKRDWVLSVLMFVVILLLGSIYTAKLFVDFQVLDQEVTVDEKVVPTYNEGMIANVLMEYRERSATFNAAMARQQIPIVPETSESATTTDEADIEKEMDDKPNDEEVIEDVEEDSEEDGPVLEVE